MAEYTVTRADGAKFRSYAYLRYNTIPARWSGLPPDNWVDKVAIAQIEKMGLARYWKCGPWRWRT